MSLSLILFSFSVFCLFTFFPLTRKLIFVFLYWGYFSYKEASNFSKLSVFFAIASKSIFWSIEMILILINFSPGNKQLFLYSIELLFISINSLISLKYSSLIKSRNVSVVYYKNKYKLKFENTF